MEAIGCQTCEYNAHLFHKDMPYGCWCDQQHAIGTGCYEIPQVLNKKRQAELWLEWIKNHPNWQGTPHIKYWYYCDTQKEFDEFIKAYPDAEHAPNSSWKSMYDILVLE